MVLFHTKHFYRLVAGTGLFLIFFLAIPVSGEESPAAPLITGNASCSPFMLSDPEFDFEVKRTLSTMYSRGSDLGEVVATAARIDPLTYENWYTEWTKTAEHFRAIGDTAFAEGHLVTAHDAWLRAQTYYRTAEFFLHDNPDDPRILDSWKKSRDTFRDAMNLDPVSMEIVSIPYENTSLPGYFYSSGNSSEKRPLLIIQTGYDGTQEELYANALEGVRRGYHVLTFEGPGQGEVIRVQKFPFRADWEAVVTPVLDWASSRPDVDPERIALWGISMGGFLAPRAAAFDDRISALIADSGIYDMAADEVNQFRKGSPDPQNITRQDVFDFITENRDYMNEDMYARMNNSTSMDWGVTQGMYVFMVDTPADVMLAYKDYTMEGIIEKIKCPTLVTDGVSDSKMGTTQAKIFYDNLKCPKTYLLFSNDYCAGEHCQLGASAISYQEKFDWLDEQLKP
jgi:dipeptidyl aminopeptidase/acylaminoacyl peptidase